MSQLKIKGSRVFIAGGAGFVGSNLCKELLIDSPEEVVILDNFLSSEPENVPTSKSVTLVNGSASNLNDLKKLGEDFDFVFNLCCLHGNQSSIYDPFADHQNNLLPALTLADYFKNSKKLKKFVYAAAGCAVADKTYDEAQATSEEAPVNMFQDSPYSISKLVGEFYGNYYFTRDGLPFVKARFQNVYGPGEVLGAGCWRGTPHSVWRNVTPTFIFRSMMKEALPLDNGGLVSRDFIYVKDLAKGLIACALKGTAGEAYNMATGRETMIKDLARMINELTGNPTQVDLKPARDWDRSGRRFGDPKKAQRELDFEMSTSIKDGLKQTVEWSMRNKELILATMLKHKRFLPELEKYNQ